LIFMLIGFFGESIYTVDRGAQAYVIEVAEGEGGEAEAGSVDVEALMAEADPGAGATIWRRCAACHSLDEGVNMTGPSLAGVVGRDIASIDGFSYSSALSSLDGSWDYEHLFGFLENPRGYAPGTTMIFAGLPSPEDRANIIAYLESGGS